MAQPELGGSEFKHGEEGGRVIFVVRGDASEVFDPVEEASDAIARPIE